MANTIIATRSQQQEHQQCSRDNNITSVRLRDYIVKDVTLYTGCPKKRLALGKHLELALNGFQMGIFNPEKICHSVPFLGQPKMYSTS